MDWVLRSPQIHTVFSSLGYVHPDGYHVNESCNSALEAILQNILSEDKYLRNYRRSISFGQNIKKDLIPLLLNAKEDKTIELVTIIMVNLTTPIECLLSLETVSKSDFGRHTIFEINNLLACAKKAFTDQRVTKVVIDFLKKYLDLELHGKLKPEHCSNISNSLLLLRNILHIPEDNIMQPLSTSSHGVQNQILWNSFSQGIDKVLIKLMSVPDACYWGVTMVQLVALMYKDQHVVTLQKLLNLWLEASLSESSEDNESNTSSSDRNSKNSSPMLTSEPPSDSSDTGSDGKNNGLNDSIMWKASSDPASDNVTTKHPATQPIEPSEQPTEALKSKSSVEDNIHDSMKCHYESPAPPASFTSGMHSQESKLSEQSEPSVDKKQRKNAITENSDCGYGTQIENQESISTSSNEDDLPFKKPIHRKPHNTKQRANTKIRTATTLQDRKRKRMVKRGKSNIINVQGLNHETPTDDDIANVMKEFTIDFLLKGYNSLIKTLHYQILTNKQLEIDTSHFFWLVTYFLKFATQIEMGLEHVDSVLSFDIVSYLTAEGVNLCENFELAIKLDGNDLSPCVRRLHLVVTAIREFVQAIEMYKRNTHSKVGDQEKLMKLQIKMCETEELRSLLVLLIRHYNPKYQSKQYLQDLIVTNHILLVFLDGVMKLPDYKGSGTMVDHIRQFASPEMMYQYGILLEDYATNGEYVNDCIFTIMHHVGGDLGSLITLFQPRILKTFTSLWKSDFEVCDDWNDLIEYVINKFVKKPQSSESLNIRLHLKDFDDEILSKILGIAPAQTDEINEMEMNMAAAKNIGRATSIERWTEDEISSLIMKYVQCNKMPDYVGEILKLFKEDGITKTRVSIINELFNQNILNNTEFDTLMKGENEDNNKTTHSEKETREDEIDKICVQLAYDGQGKLLKWVQKVLLETCHAKIYLDKINAESVKNDCKLLNFELFKKKAEEMPSVSPVSYHSLILNQSVPLVPWNCEQAKICKDLKFLQLLHKLGFHMPVDSGKVFICIPHFWTADFLYNVASKISPIDTSKLEFSVNEFAETSAAKPGQEGLIFSEMYKAVTMTVPENIYQIQRQKHFATMVNFTPMPGCSYNSENSNIDNRNWLTVIQQSQELKLTSTIVSHIVREEHIEVVMPPPPPPPLQNMLLPGRACESLLSMTSMINAPKENISYDLHQDDNSVCDTASVASDLTRMYVSDEDEKPVQSLNIPSDLEPAAEELTDQDDCPVPRKRARIT